MTPFQQYTHERWTHDFPQWACLREDLEIDGNVDSIEIRYMIPSPANPNNILYVVFTRNDLIVKFAVQGSHEHYDPDLYCSTDTEMSETEKWDVAYSDAINEYVLPVIQDKLFVVWYIDGAVLTSNVSDFVNINGIDEYKYESWTSALSS